MIIPKKAFGLVLLLLLGTVLVLFSRTVGTSLAEYFFGPRGPVVPFTTHIVLFQFKDGTSSFAIKEITSELLALKKACVHPQTLRPYIVSISGGKDISTEKLQDGISHAFVLQFHSIEDRDYYVDEDPVHKAFKEAASSVVKKAIVVDYQNGVFTKAG
ncbi:stress responsive A/B barrel domain-containing protein [Decorospora gaudefroyi]|uniref:Stress responsive A/B barrel domain-containing protein n=1 Tax=Decorospora gaudefroyi TaxID=184978 RepID=A0A6A5KL37_9PLEO|nr:stress responsive A/B barrel domain-containing protein [Decorospora gaudefroyi]